MNLIMHLTNFWSRSIVFVATSYMYSLHMHQLGHIEIVMRVSWCG